MLCRGFLRNGPEVRMSLSRDLAKSAVKVFQGQSKDKEPAQGSTADPAVTRAHLKALLQALREKVRRKGRA